MATYNGTSKANTYYGTHWADTINGNDGNDHLFGQGGNDHINGGAHEDKLDGGDGNDALIGGAGRDQIYGGKGDDLSDGGIGDDYIWDLWGSNTLSGNDGNDRLVTNQFSDIHGGTGNDTLVLKLDGQPKEGSAEFNGHTGKDTLLINIDDTTMDFTFIELTGVSSSGVKGNMGLQSDVMNSDYWTRVDAGTFENVESFQVKDEGQLYFTGRVGSGQPAAQDVTVQGGSRNDFIDLGMDNETVTLGAGSDAVYATGFYPNAAPGVMKYGTDHITDFNADEGDLLLLGWGEHGSRVEIEETASQTIVKAFTTNAGNEEMVNTIVVDAVGIQDSIWDGWTPV